MKTVRIPLVGSSTGKGVSLNLDTQANINLMQEFADSPDAKSGGALIYTPGLRTLANSDGTNPANGFTGQPMRGLYEIPPNTVGGAILTALLIVTGGEIYRGNIDEVTFLSTGVLNRTYTAMQALPAGNPFVRFAEGPLSILIATGGDSINGYGYLYNIAAESLSAALVFDATSGDFVPMVDVAYLDGFFFAVCNVTTTDSPQPYQQIFYSPDGSSWSALDFTRPSATAGQIKRILIKNDHIWVFKDDTVPIFAATGVANNPIAPIETATIPHGCVDGGPVAQGAEFIYWVGGNSQHSGLTVYRANSAAAVDIANDFVKRTLQTLSDMGPILNGSMSGFCKTEHGHPLYFLHLLNAKTTLVFDEVTSKWHERRWWNVDTGAWEAEVGWVTAGWSGKSLVGDRRLSLANGGDVSAIYESSETFFDNQISHYLGSPSHDAGTDTFIRRERIGAHISGALHEKVTIACIELEFERGHATANGQGSDPAVTLQISRDGGETYSSGLTRNIGKIGQYKGRAQFNRLGTDFDFVPKIVMTDPIGWKLIQAWATLELGSN